MCLATPMFSSAIRDDAYEFLIDCQERLHKYVFFECHGVAYKTYQLTDVARK